jgi:DNA-directed RNA polymerase specialized sigma24 family protein
MEKVGAHHEEWLRYIHKMGATTHAEDLVQEMYLRLDRYNCGDIVILENGKVHKSYIWTVLSNIFKTYKTSSNKFQFINIDECIGLEVEQLEDGREDAYERIMQKMFKEIDQLDKDGYPYNKELFNLYVESAMSMRCISSVTNISLTSIFNTLKQCKEQLSDELREDIEDFNNGEYNLIK